MKTFFNRNSYAAILLAFCMVLTSCQKSMESNQAYEAVLPSQAGSLSYSGKDPGLNLKVFTFNVLAPCWASPAYYPPACASKLDKAYRRGRIISFLNQAVASGAAVIALQEVQIDEFPFYYDALKTWFDGAISFHDDAYWASWITNDPPFARNGNALFLRKDVFVNYQFQDKPLTNAGNHCVYATAQDRAAGRNYRISSIHLDSDNSSRRNNELSALFASMPAQTNTIDIVAGDFNAALSNGNLSNLMRQNSFYNSLDVAGISEQTHPFTTSYNGNTNWGPIDHVAYRNARVGGTISISNNGMPTIDNGVIDFNVWSTFPAGAAWEADRINKNFDNCGSDHFPVTATLFIK